MVELVHLAPAAYDSEMTGSGQSDDSYAIADQVQYAPAGVLGDQEVGMGPDGGPVLLCHASLPLGQPRPQVSRLFVVVHGALRNSDVYLGHAWRAAELSGVTGTTLVVAPQFLAEVDATRERPLPAEALHWGVEGWKGGSPAVGPAPVSSFTAMDLLLGHVTKSMWPDIAAREQAAGTATAELGREVVITGNSAGGQFVNRYAAVGLEPRNLASCGLTVRFLISNPSSYLYFSADRPEAVAPGAKVNEWRFGFDNPVPYVAGSPQDYLRQYLSRQVILILGEEDRNPADLLLGISPPQMAQGANRFERGINYYRHVQEMAIANGIASPHLLITLPGVGHDAGDVLAAERTRRILFSKGAAPDRGTAGIGTDTTQLR
jgi:hypothetical protein